MMTSRKKTETARPERAGLGLVWVKCPRRVLTRLGLEKALGAEARVHGGQEAPAGESPSVVICCPNGEDDAALEVKSVRALYAEATVLVFFPSPDLALARDALEAGASGLIHAGMEPEQVLRAVSVAVGGEEALPRVLLRHWVDERRSLDPAALLSPRQREISGLLAEGLSNAQIARRLYLSESTVKQHLGGVYKALGVKDRNQAASLLRSRWTS